MYQVKVLKYIFSYSYSYSLCHDSSHVWYQFDSQYLAHNATEIKLLNKDCLTIEKEIRLTIVTTIADLSSFNVRNDKIIHLHLTCCWYEKF